MRRILLITLLCIIVSCQKSAGNSNQLLHVSFDPTRELFEAYNRYFIEKWKREQGVEVSISQSHGGSGKQARAVIDGLKADVVSLALAYDVQKISSLSGAINADWQANFPNRNTPFYSTVIFAVRKGNPKKILDWGDLANSGVEVIMPNPKTSGGARWNYLAAWGYGSSKFNGDQKQILEFMQKMLKNVLVFDTGARGSATTFAERGIGDVLITWESDAQLIRGGENTENFELIYPSISVRAEPVVSVVDRVIDEHKTRDLAKAYLTSLYDNSAQEIITQHHFRSILDLVMKDKKLEFPDITMVQIDNFGGWEVFHNKHFAENGVYDQLLKDG